MKTGVTILAGLLTGVLVAAGILAAFVFVGPDPIGLRPTPAPTLIPPSIAPGSPTPSVAPSASASGSPGLGSPNASAGAGAGGAFPVGQPAPALVVPQLGGGTIDLASLRGKAVWLTFLQTTCRPCAEDVSLMNGAGARHASDGLVVIAVDVNEAESVVLAFVQQAKATFLVGLDSDGAAQRAWGAQALPTHVWIDKDGIVRESAIGSLTADLVATALGTILPGVTISP